MIFVGLRARNQLILVKIIDFRPLVPQKLSVESSINDDVHQKRVSKVPYIKCNMLSKSSKWEGDLFTILRNSLYQGLLYQGLSVH